MEKLTIAGVPEHFNLPWHMALEQSTDPSVSYKWIDCTGGTGEMCSMLRNGEVDVAVVLTEGILRDINEGNPSTVLDIYVSTPLIWGVHVFAAGGFTHVAELEGKNAAISRFGSGSHLMVRVLAANEGWSEDNQSYVLVGDLPGGLLALEKGDADFFLWEKYTTQPWVKQGVLRRVGECITPWPCFVIAVNNEAWDKKQHLITALVSKVKQNAQWVKQSDEAISLIAAKCQLDPNDVREWRDQTEWFGKTWNDEMEQEVKHSLRNFGII